MFQMKEQDKISKEKLSEEETGNLPEKEFTVMIIKMIEEFERRVDAQRSQKFLTESGNKKNQTEMKNITTEIKILRESRVDQMIQKSWKISKLEGRETEIIATDQKKIE